MKNQISWANNNVAYFFSKNVTSHNVFDFILNEMKRADNMIISSFVITDKYVRRLIRSSGSISHITLILDFTLASRNVSITNFAALNVNELYLTNNHSKIIYAQNSDTEMLAIISNNATDNMRYESGIIIKNDPMIADFVNKFEIIKKDSVKWGT